MAKKTSTPRVRKHSMVGWHIEVKPSHDTFQLVFTDATQRKVFTVEKLSMYDMSTLVCGLRKWFAAYAKREIGRLENVNDAFQGVLNNEPV